MGGAFMFSREAAAFAAGTGVEGFMGPYTRGRGGVLGEVDADVVSAAFGFFEPGAVRRAWESVAMPASEAAQGYVEACRRFGMRKLESFDAAERLAGLLERVVVAGDSAGLPLFAGWRALPLGADATGRVEQLIQVLREFRGGAHLLAVRATGLTPQQAVLVKGGPMGDGSKTAANFGWPEPYAEVDADVVRRWEAAEALTDELVAPAFSVLGDVEGKELVELVRAAHAVMFARR
ncbi:hypothetical protein EBN03_08830 [Nocardia stercoris]|uniref:EvbL n=2 Tax=Nocardia stercoris TaxID=2483361 RepID=A0A3M2L7P1_9NOCA|nr:hypothetical protein EBN03_08830 [Nocardia stercoris]